MATRRSASWRSVASAIVLVFVCGAFSIMLVPVLHTYAQYAYEDAMFALSPSAERAFAYGEKHFNATDTNDYDVRRAEYFFKIAASKDPTIPYLYHELARISFLRGAYTKAMAQINFQISMHGTSAPNSYYVRGLIEGYMSNYDAAIRDYSYFLTFDPNNWAGINDYAWVLLKANRPKDALAIIRHGLDIHPGNPWLLNSYTIALYETGDLKDAVVAAHDAVEATAHVSIADWLTAYPGNDPQAAGQGVAQLKAAAQENMNRVQLALSTSTVQ